MKKIFLAITLLFSCIWGEESSDSQWRGFFGVEAGVGMIRLFHQPIPLPSVAKSQRIKRNAIFLEWQCCIGWGLAKIYKRKERN